MVEQRKALDAQASGLMILLCMIWGMQQAVLKLAAPDVAPIMQIALRSGLAALLVLPFIRLPQGTHLYAKEYLLPGIWLALLAGAMWALTTISLRLGRLSEAPAAQTLFYQLAGCFIFLTPAAWLSGQSAVHWSAIALGSMLFHVLIMSFFSLMLWFWLLRKYLANGLGVFSFLTPIFGIIFGVALLDERIELNFIFGTALVMAGVMTVSLHAWIGRVFGLGLKRFKAMR